MPAPIEAGFINFITPFVQEVYEGLEVFDGELPRYSSAGNPITIDGPIPAFRVVMTDEGFTRQWTMADPYGDEGILNIEGWTTTRAASMTLLNTVEAPLVKASNWDNILLPGGPVDNPYSVYKVLLRNWTCIQVEGFRTQSSNLIYYGRLTFQVGVHGAINTEQA
jgi:hypothetical protein